MDIRTEIITDISLDEVENERLVLILAKVSGLSKDEFTDREREFASVLRRTILEES